MFVGDRSEGERAETFPVLNEHIGERTEGVEGCWKADG
jgi:hypothetical protein